MSSNSSAFRIFAIGGCLVALAAGQGGCAKSGNDVLGLEGGYGGDDSTSTTDAASTGGSKTVSGPGGTGGATEAGSGDAGSSHSSSAGVGAGPSSSAVGSGGSSSSSTN